MGDHIVIIQTISNEEDDDQIKYPACEGYLNKWTNYIFGWQKRWIVLKDGTLSYYKTRNETGCGCRGAISLQNACIKAHEFDPCRFDVAVNDCVWCLRTESEGGREFWLKYLIASKQRADSGYNSQGSSGSLQSNTLSVGSSSSSLTFQKSLELKSKLIEVDALRESLCKQVDNLREQFVKHLPPDDADKQSIVNDFKLDVMTCKATANNISEILLNCIDLISLQEDAFAKCLEQETAKKVHVEETGKRRMVQKRAVAENEVRATNEDEFYDAVEPIIETMENKQTKADENENETVIPSRIEHRLSAEVDRVTAEQVKYAKMGISRDGWQLFTEEGAMKMYRREEEQDGLVVDPLKACHFVNGFTAREICDYFFSPEFRYEWETTLDPNGMTVVEELSDDTVVFHQVHKRVWPAAQRDSLFWSHMRQVPIDETDDENVYNTWVVVNHSTDVDAYPANATGKYVRVYMTVCLMCQTVLLDLTKDLSQLNRNDIACKITYCATINPGGWAPSAALRVIYKKEYPRFLRKFTAYVTQKTKENPIKL